MAATTKYLVCLRSNGTQDLQKRKVYQMLPGKYPAEHKILAKQYRTPHRIYAYQHPEIPWQNIRGNARYLDSRIFWR